jgi:hypothetical protein
MGKEGLHLGAEQNRTVGQRPMEQRSDTDAVARQHEPAQPTIPERYRELPIQLLHEVEPLLLVEVDERLRVAMRSELVTALDEILPQLEIVEDLAVEGHPNGAVLVTERLLTGTQVDDGQPAMSQADARLEMEALFIGPTMRQGSRHALDGIFVYRPSIPMPEPGYAAHAVCSTFI